MSTDCLFCDIAAGDMDADVVYEDDDVVAFRDIEPKAPTHLLVIPRTHVPDWTTMVAQSPELAQPLMEGVAAAADTVGVDEYRVVANTGSRAGQTVFHLHLHLLGGRPMLWPPG